MASSPVWTVIVGNGKSIILCNQLVDKRSEELRKCLVANISPPSIRIPLVQDWIFDWSCIGTFLVSKIDSFQALISLEVIEEALGC